MSLRSISVIIFCLVSGCAEHQEFDDCVLDQPLPQSISQATDRLGLLPGPVSIPCYIASLPRPLSVVATDNIFSAQPADGRENPRVFLLSEGLVTSFVLDGPGQHLLEFGEWETTTRTIKGELAFPLATSGGPPDPYDVLYNPSATRCSFCHLGEVEVVDRPGVFSSAALQPSSSTLVPVDEIQREHRHCRHQHTPERCRLLHALADYGALEDGQFDEEVQHIFE